MPSEETKAHLIVPNPRACATPEEILVENERCRKVFQVEQRQREASQLWQSVAVAAARAGRPRAVVVDMANFAADKYIERFHKEE